MILIDELYRNYKRYFRIAWKVCKRAELAEEILQQTALKLILLTDKVNNPKSFISQAIFNQALNRSRVQKKYDYNYNSVEIISYHTPEIELLQRDNRVEIQSLMGALPRKQRIALGNWFGLSEIALENQNYESNKTNKRLALMKLKTIANKDNFYLDEAKENIVRGKLYDKK